MKLDMSKLSPHPSSERKHAGWYCINDKDYAEEIRVRILLLGGNECSSDTLGYRLALSKILGRISQDVVFWAPTGAIKDDVNAPQIKLAVYYEALKILEARDE